MHALSRQSRHYSTPGILCVPISKCVELRLGRISCHGSAERMRSEKMQTDGHETEM